MRHSALRCAWHDPRTCPELLLPELSGLRAMLRWPVCAVYAALCHAMPYHEASRLLALQHHMPASL